MARKNKNSGGYDLKSSQDCRGSEFSYKVSEDGLFNALAQSEEVLTFSAYAESSELSDNVPQSYGDKLVQGLSAKSGVSRFSEFSKLPEDTVAYIFAVLYLAVGAICVAVPALIISVLPYIVGGLMILIGAVRFVIALVGHEYRHVKTNRTAASLILAALGIMIIVQHFRADDAAITFIAIVWGVLGLFEGAYAFNHAFKRIANAERAVYYVLKGIVEIAVAFLLLYDPSNHDTHNLHIIVFGCNLIVDAVTMLPFVKNFMLR